MKKIIISKDGPYIVSGKIPLAKEIAVGNINRGPEEWVRKEELKVPEKYLLCRCGQSGHKPFCDSTHLKVGFDGTEDGKNNTEVDHKEVVFGPELDLIDQPELCSGTRFCHFGRSTWTDVRHSDNPESKENAVRSACNCPSGRLVLVDKKTRQMIEPELEQSIGITEDPEAGVSGPLWVKGGVQIESADGSVYEKRNRVTLCRCGKSGIMPFCDATHMRTGFKDGDESLKKE